MTNEKLLAKDCLLTISEAEKHKEAPFMILDYQGHFGNGKYNLDTFREELKAFDFECVPLEKSLICFFPLKGKYVVQPAEKPHTAARFGLPDVHKTKPPRLSRRAALPFDQKPQHPL